MKKRAGLAHARENSGDANDLLELYTSPTETLGQNEYSHPFTKGLVYKI